MSKPGWRSRPEDPALKALSLALSARQEAEDNLLAAVRGAREAGWPWGAIADRLGLVDEDETRRSFRRRGIA